VLMTLSNFMSCVPHLKTPLILMASFEDKLVK